MNTKIDLIRAWKDEEYRAGLSADELAGLPQNPAGMVELNEKDLLEVSGASEDLPTHNSCYLMICRPSITITITFPGTGTLL